VTYLNVTLWNIRGYSVDPFEIRLIFEMYEIWRLRHYAASRKVAGSSPDEVDFFKLT
jgi:hypothetical protein